MLVVWLCWWWISSSENTVHKNHRYHGLNNDTVSRWTQSSDHTDRNCTVRAWRPYNHTLRSKPPRTQYCLSWVNRATRQFRVGDLLPILRRLRFFVVFLCCSLGFGGVLVVVAVAMSFIGVGIAELMVVAFLVIHSVRQWKCWMGFAISWCYDGCDVFAVAGRGIIRI